MSCEVAVVSACHAASHASSPTTLMPIGSPGGRTAQGLGFSEFRAGDDCRMTSVK